MSGSAGGSGAGTTEPFAWGADGVLERKRVTQCALSRVCGVCSQSLGRPIAFVATPDEVARNEVHAPPLHATCADGLLGWSGADPSWQVVTTAGFEFVRPARDDADQALRFRPHALL